MLSTLATTDEIAAGRFSGESCRFGLFEEYACSTNKLVRLRNGDDRMETIVLAEGFAHRAACSHATVAAGQRCTCFLRQTGDVCLRGLVWPTLCETKSPLAFSCQAGTAAAYPEDLTMKMRTTSTHATGYVAPHGRAIVPAVSGRVRTEHLNYHSRRVKSVPNGQVIKAVDDTLGGVLVF